MPPEPWHEILVREGCEVAREEREASGTRSRSIGNFIPCSSLTFQDVWTYQAVGIPMFRIFTINHRGELRHELTNTFQSSWVGSWNQYYPIVVHGVTHGEFFRYLSMSQIADQLFPVRSTKWQSSGISLFWTQLQQISNPSNFLCQSCCTSIVFATAKDTGG